MSTHDSELLLPLLTFKSVGIKKWAEPEGATCWFSCPEVVWFKDTDDLDTSQMFI